MIGTLVQRFRTQLEERLGLDFAERQDRFLDEVLHRRAGRRGPELYLQQLEQNFDEQEVSRLATELTVGETSFFRHSQQLQVFVQVAVPARLRARDKTRKLSILSVGCASREEPYSLAMLLHQHFSLSGRSNWNVQILGVDVNPDVLRLARRGIYSEWSLRETPPTMLNRWFIQRGQQFHLDQKILDLVQFEERNLNLSNPDLWLPSRWDIVLCRNMLMYFTPERARVLLQRLTGGLAEDGFLFLGPAENLRGLSQDFVVHHRSECFYYQLAGSRQASPLRTGAALLAQSAPVAERSTPPEDLSVLCVLLEQERYAQALELLRGWRESPRSCLWRVSILVNRGEFAEAESLLETLLEPTETEAGARFFLGLCRREAGELGQARACFERALWLDPSLALAALYLGMLLRRLALQAQARPYLRQALVLLQRESDERLLLFGGGFRRSAWLALCQNELDSYL
ncbi:chemotaxis protein CheR [bacterium]|nr:chemotaxis protein CheR [bacterium]